MTGWRALLDRTTDHAVAYLDTLPDRPVGARVGVDVLRHGLGGPLPDEPSDPEEVIAHLARAVEPGLVASGSGRFFGWVFGGSLPAALAADWLTSAWDQNGGMVAASPAAAVVEDVAGEWLLDLLGLPESSSVGFTTGATTANFAGLAAARQAVLDRVGWDVGRRGMSAAPAIRVLVGGDRHLSIDLALRYLGFGTDDLVVVDADDQGRMRSDALAAALAEGEGEGPTIVCTQAGNVSTGASDPFAEIVEVSHRAGAWVHVDGAFGLWAAASPRTRDLVAGVEGADSWATDAHKWLNVPYDCGVVICAHPDAHRRALAGTAAYLVRGEELGDPFDLVPEMSRRARGFTVWAALKSLGRSGVVDLVDRTCGLAQRFAAALDEVPDAVVFNDVVLNQVLLRVGDDDVTNDVGRRVVDSGLAFLTPTTWRGQTALRVSVCNWSTTDADVDTAIGALRAAASSVTDGADETADATAVTTR